MTDDCKECGKPLPNEEKNKQVDQLVDDIVNGKVSRDMDEVMKKLDDILGSKS